MRKIETHTAKDGATSYKVRFRHQKKQTSETFSTKRDAQQFAKWLDALGAQGAIDQLYLAEQQADVPSLDAVAAQHIELLTGVEPGTRKTYERLWDRTWSPLLGRTPANRLTRDDIARAVNELGERYSRKSLENQRGLLAAVVQRAVDEGHLPKNPVRGIRLPRGQEAESTEMRIITPDEFAQLITRIPANYRPFVRFLYGTGCRWGEAVALQVQDVNLPNVRIRRALKWSPDNQRKVGATKTRRSNRTVLVGDIMLDDLRAVCEGKRGDQLVFTAPRGGAILHRTFWSRVWLPAVSPQPCAEHLTGQTTDEDCDDCWPGMTPRPRIHDLRHSHASVLLAAGVPIHVVQARLGHETIQTTVDTYSHLLPDAQQVAANAASLAFGSTPRLPA